MDKIFHSTFDFFSHALPGACIAGAYYLIAQKDINSVIDLFEKANEAKIGIGIFLLLGGYVIGLGIYPIGRWLYKGVNRLLLSYEGFRKDRLVRKQSEFFSVKDNVAHINDEESYERMKELIAKREKTISILQIDPNLDPGKVKGPDGSYIDAEPPLALSDKFILIRELSPSNFKYVETWHMFCAMCHNLAIACILIFIMMLVKVDFSSLGNFFYSNDYWFFIMTLLLILAGLFIDRAITFSIWAANDLNAAITRLNLIERAKNLPEPQAPPPAGK